MGDLGHGSLGYIVVGLVMPVRSTGLMDGLRYFQCSYTVYLFGAAPALDAPRGIDPRLGSIALRQGVILGPIIEINTESPVEAQIRGNKWVAQCPGCETDFQYIWLDNPLYMCSICWNATTGGIYRAVTLPEGVKEITYLLEKRPVLATRNWLPGQVIEELEAENAENGVN